MEVVYVLLSIMIALFVYVYLWPWLSTLTMLIKVWWVLHRMAMRVKKGPARDKLLEARDLTFKVIKEEEL